VVALAVCATLPRQLTLSGNADKQGDRMSGNADKLGDRMSGNADKQGDRVLRQAPSERRASMPCCVEVAERIGTVLYMMLVVAGRRGSDGGH